jgi:hypothetical protein
VSRNTVRKVLRSRETSFEYERNVQPRPKLVDGQLRSTNCWKAMRPNLLARI